ncbi:MAG: M28 family peptidase [Acidobacteria bacterium]|nr:M28 family peptidase [Acidobacteriota bacterium]
MTFSGALQVTVLTLACAGTPCAGAPFSGERALAHTRKVVAFGPRPPGSPAIRKLQSHILAELKTSGAQVSTDEFTASTPVGPVAMKNLIARWPGKSGRAVVFSGHYDTKSMPGIPFVGANDGGSSTGFLLEMARALAARPRVDDVYLVWFDGEEAFGPWSATDGIYGSRHLAARWAREGTLGRLKALINVDMIGDRRLGLLKDANSTPWLRELVWATAARLGYGNYFLAGEAGYVDDHEPFLKLGVSALALIDFDYGPGNSYWHTPHDTMDKLSAQSFEVVGTVLLEVLKTLEARR